MEVRLLGSTEVGVGDRLVRLPSGRARALLALLALHPGEMIAAERLVDELWGDRPPPTAATIVQGLVSKLRKALEPDRSKGASAATLQTIGAGYRLGLDPHDVDASRFIRLTDQARVDDPRVRASGLAAALRLWRGPALADFRYEPFAQGPIARLEEVRLDAIEDRIEAEMAIGAGIELVAELGALAAEHPYRERLPAFLMIALYRAGRQREALDVYTQARKVLADELGLEPGPALRDIHRAVLRHDPSLDATAAPARARADTSTSWLPRERRAVTVVSMDLTPDAVRDVDAEAWGRAAQRAARTAAATLEGFGGRVERLLDDRVVAFFGFPVVHEDDALRAVRASVDAVAAVARLNVDHPRFGGVRHRSRTGIESGEIVLGSPGGGLHDALTGAAVAAATRLQQHAADDEVTVGPAVRRLVSGAVILKPCDQTDAGGTRAWRVVEIVHGAPAIPRALDRPMFGRQRELTRCRSAFRRAVRSQRPVRMSIVGEAGIGKSRLAAEVVSSLAAEADAIALRTPPHVDGATLIPLRHVVVEAAGLRGWRALHDILATPSDEHVPDRIVAAIGLSAEPKHANELFEAARDLFEALSGVRPLIVVFDDLHWAPSTMLELIEDVARTARGALLMLGLRRSDPADDDLADSDEGAVRLEPLADEDVRGLIVERGGYPASDDLDRIVELSRGNPLFAEQLLAALGEGTVGTVPASLGGLITLRLQRLGPGERDLLRCASVVGDEFRLDGVAALLPPGAGPFVERHLDVLERKRFIAATDGTLYHFDHGLIQAAAYDSMTREDRARLHARYAEWLERESAYPRSETEQLIRFHRQRSRSQARASGIELEP